MTLVPVGLPSPTTMRGRWAAVDALVAADAAPTVDELRAVADVPGWGLEAGVVAARAFRG